MEDPGGLLGGFGVVLFFFFVFLTPGFASVSIYPSQSGKSFYPFILTDLSPKHHPAPRSDPSLFLFLLPVRAGKSISFFSLVVFPLVGDQR